MLTEYWLQKKAFNSWSHVTWYDSLEEAKKNLDKVAVEGNGYSWRMVKVDVVEERLLFDESPVLRPEPEEAADEFKSSWGKPKPEGIINEWGQATVQPSHGMIGKVWLGNPTTKEKKRVDPEVASELLKTGNWIKAGPRTVL